jgi:MFS family permease
VAVVDALTFLAGAALIAAVRTPGVPERAGEHDDAAGAASHALLRLARDWLDGLRAIRSSRVVKVLLGANALTAVGEGVFAVMFLVWVERTLLGGALEYGWLMSGQAIGGVAGGLVGGWLVRQLPPERMYGVGLLAFGFFDALLFNYPLVLSGVALGVVLIAIVGVPGVAAMAARQTLIQTNVPDRFLGRVFSALGTTSALIMLGSTLLAGAIGDRVSPIAILNVQAAGFLLSGAAVLWLLRPSAVTTSAGADRGARVG